MRSLIPSNPDHHHRKRLTWRKIAAAVGAVALLLVGGAFLFLMHQESKPALMELRTASPVREDASLVFFTGDMGMPKQSMGGSTVRRLAASGYVVTVIDSPAAFKEQKTPAQVAQLLEKAMRVTAARNPETPLVLIGQSFGADMIPVAMAGLPAEMKRKISEIILIVPGTHGYLEVSPREMAGIPPADLALAPFARKLPPVRVTCIFGVEEKASLCPAFAGAPNAKVVGLPGGHMLNRDHRALYAVVSRELRTNSAG